MSFQDLEAGALRRPPLQLPQVVAHAVFQINTKVAALRHLGDALGTPKDTPALRSRLRVTRAEAARLAKITSRKLNQNADDSADATERIAPDSKSKLATDFEAALRDFQQVLHRIVAVERPIISAHAAAAALTVETQQQLLATGMEDHEAILIERELGILEAQHAITDIDDMLRNLATLVDEQDGSVDHVMCDIEKIAAEQEISGMVETPATRSSERCLMAFVLGLFLFIFVLVLYGISFISS
jgi:syntaxin 7